MKSIFDFILENKEWIFSGIGIAVISLFVSVFRRKSFRLYQRGGKGSTNIQVGGNISVNDKIDGKPDE